MGTPLGFDLTQFGGTTPLQRVPAPVRQEPEQPAPQQQPIMADPNMPQNINDALTKPLDSQIANDDGTEFQDKLAKNAPGLKKSLWGIDKFASPVRPVRVVQDGKEIWMDANGNNILDPDTGRILTKPNQSGSSLEESK